jgi:hypothetical protein
MILTDFKNIHKDQDIYILASGKSVDFIDNSFFKNKIIIGVNQVYKKTKCKYLVRKDVTCALQIFKNTLINNPETIHFVSEGNHGGNNKNNSNLINKEYINNDNIVVFPHNINGAKLRASPDFFKLLTDKLFVSHSTITTAMHLAAYMGAKNILLVGHDAGLINNECNFTGYHDKNSYHIAWKNGKEDYKKWLYNIDNETIIVKKLLIKEYNCNIHSINPFINLEGNIYTKKAK